MGVVFRGKVWSWRCGYRTYCTDTGPKELMNDTISPSNIKRYGGGGGGGDFAFRPKNFFSLGQSQG